MSTLVTAGRSGARGSPLLLADSEQCLEKIPASADKPPVTQPAPPASSQRTDSRLKGMPDCLSAEAPH